MKKKQFVVVNTLGISTDAEVYLVLKRSDQKPLLWMLARIVNNEGIVYYKKLADIQAI